MATNNAQNNKQQDSIMRTIPAYKKLNSVAVLTATAGISSLIQTTADLNANWNNMSGAEKVASMFKLIANAALTAASALAAYRGISSKGLAVAGIVATLATIASAFASFKASAQGFAEGGYTNANFIMTHENGKREWVGKAAGSSAIVNDTQMSDIMEGAVAKGVYNALVANSTTNSSTNNKNVFKFYMNSREIFSAFEEEGNRQGKFMARSRQ